MHNSSYNRAIAYGVILLSAVVLGGRDGLASSKGVNPTMAGIIGVFQIKAKH